MVWDGGRFRPASSFSNQMTVTAPRGGLGALGAASGSLNIGSRGGGSSGMTGGGGSYVSPGQATVPTEEEQYNIRKNAVHKALKELAKAVVSARAFDYGASGLTTEQKQQAVTDAREELEKLGVTRDEIEAYNTGGTFRGMPNHPLSPRLGKGNIVDTAKDFLADATQSVYEGIDTGFETFGALTGLGDPDQVGPTVPWGVGGQWGATGKQTPVRIGTAKDGTPIVLYIPGGGILGGAQQAAQQGGGWWDIVKGGVGGIATTAATTAALNAADNQDNKDKETTKGGVLLNPAGLGDESTSGETGVIDTDQVKTTGVDTNTGGAGTDAIVTGGAGTDTTLTGGGQDVSLGTAGLAASDIINTGGDSFSLGTGGGDSFSLGTGGRDTDTIKTGGDSFSIETLGRDTDTIKTGGYEAWLEEAGLEPAAEKVAEKVAEKTGGGSSSSGGGLPAGGSGIAEVAGEPGDLVDIDYLFDVGGDSIFAPDILEEDEDELLYPYSGGGAVKRFSGAAGSVVNQGKTAQDYFDATSGKNVGEEKSIFQKGLPALIGAGLGAAFGLIDEDDPNPSGYQGGIPEYKYKRSLVPNAFSTTNADGTPRRPGSAGRSYFTEGAYDPVMETFTADGKEITQQRTLDGAQRRADAVAAAAQAKEDENYIAQIGQDFLDLQPVDNTATAGSAEAADAGTGSVVDAGAAGAAGAAAGGAGAVDTGAGGVDLTGGAGVDTVGADTVTDFQKFNTFLAPFYNKVLNNEDFLALGGSGYEVSQLAAALGVDGQKLFDAIANATNVSGAFNKDAVDYLTNTGSVSIGGAGDDTVEVSDLQKFSNFLTPFYNRDLTTQDILALGNSGYSVSQLAQALGIKGSDLTAAIANAEALSSAFNATAENSASSADTTNVDDTLIQVSNPNILVQEEINDLVARINAQELTVADVAAKYGLTDQQVQNEVDRINLSNINAVDEAGVEYLLSEINAGNLTVADVATRYGLTEKEVQDTVNALNKQAMTDVILDAASANTIAANADDLFVDTDFTDFNIFGSGGAGDEGFQRPLASGGMLHGDGYYLGGTTDGMADQVPATIGGQEPARLSDGEFVVPADVVSHLGNGNSDAGATQLYSMMDRVRKKRTGTTQQGAEINPMQQLPA